MPAKSKQQFKYVYAMRNKYGTKKKAPKNINDSASHCPIK